MKVVNFYKYLGIIFSCRLKWSVCCKTLSAQCEKALNLIKHCMCKLGTRDITLGFRLFDSMAAPILFYGAEVWGTSIRSEIETVQNKFCKWLLGMGQKVNNHIARGECGRYELYINYMCRPIKYFLHIQKLDENRLPKQCYRMMFKMNENGRVSWCTKIQELLFHHGFGHVWENQGVEDDKLFISLYEQRLKDINFQHFSEYICNSSKCSFYSKVNDPISINSINDHIHKLSFNLRFEVLSIICSNHKLAIEQGRRNNELRENRLCQICNLNIIEDEYHFLLVCPVLSDIRRNFLPVWCYVNPNKEKLVKLFRTNDFAILRNLAIYIKKGKYIRDEILSL